MSTYKVGRKTSTNEIEVIPSAASFTSGFVSIGTAAHEDLFSGTAEATDPVDNAGHNHVLWHHIRKLLYDLGDINPSKYSIILRTLTAFTITPTTATKAAAQTQQITIASVTPANALDQRFTYSSSDTTKATVNAAGLVTAVATGSATIKVTHTGTGLTRTMVLTIS
jgi:hypothetical protein